MEEGKTIEERDKMNVVNLCRTNSEMQLKTRNYYVRREIARSAHQTAIIGRTQNTERPTNQTFMTRQKETMCVHWEKHTQKLHK